MNKIKQGALTTFPFFPQKLHFRKSGALKRSWTRAKKDHDYFKEEKLKDFFAPSPPFGTRNKLSFSEEILSETQYLYLTSDALPFDAKETGFEISGLHKAVWLRRTFYKAFPKFKS